MKKSLLFIAFAALATVASAQDMTSKRGVPILPEQGDYALGFDAVPFIEYFGNVLNGTNDQSSPSPWFTQDSPFSYAIYGKKFVAADKAYRARVRLGFGNSKLNYEVPDKPTWTDTVNVNETYGQDESKYSYTAINLGAGVECRRGKGRVQGFWGPEIWVGMENGKYSYKYHNAIDSTMTAGSYEISQYTGTSTITSDGKRITEYKMGSEFAFGIRAFVGVEYFFAPKMSVSGELGWGIGLSSRGASKMTTEYYEPLLSNGSGGVRTETRETGKASGFGLDTDNAYGSINLLFHF